MKIDTPEDIYISNIRFSRPAEDHSIKFYKMPEFERGGATSIYA